MNNVLGLFVALISGGALVSVAFVNGWFGKKKIDVEANNLSSTGLRDDLRFIREELVLERHEKTEYKAEIKILKDQLLYKETDWTQQMKDLTKEVEFLRETVMKLRTELGLKPISD